MHDREHRVAERLPRGPVIATGREPAPASSSSEGSFRRSETGGTYGSVRFVLVLVLAGRWLRALRMQSTRGLRSGLDRGASGSESFVRRSKRSSDGRVMVPRVVGNGACGLLAVLSAAFRESVVLALGDEVGALSAELTVTAAGLCSPAPPCGRFRSLETCDRMRCRCLERGVSYVVRPDTVPATSDRGARSPDRAVFILPSVRVRS